MTREVPQVSGKAPKESVASRQLAPAIGRERSLDAVAPKRPQPVSRCPFPTSDQPTSGRSHPRETRTPTPGPTHDTSTKYNGEKFVRHSLDHDLLPGALESSPCLTKTEDTTKHYPVFFHKEVGNCNLLHPKPHHFSKPILRPPNFSPLKD